MPIKEKARRNTRIYKMYKKTQGYGYVGEEFGLSRWTVRQIVKREDQRAKKNVGK